MVPGFHPLSEEIRNVPTKSLLFVKLLLCLTVLLAASSAYATTLPACSTMAGSNELCGVISGTLAVTSGPDPLGLSGSVLTAVTGNENTGFTAWTSGWSVLGAPVNPGSTASYGAVPLTLATNLTPFTLACQGGASVSLSTSSSQDTLNVNSCSLSLAGISVDSTITATINFPGGTLPQALNLPFSSVAIGSGSSATYTCNDTALCPTAIGVPTTLSINNGTISSTCVGCTTLGITPTSPGPLTFTATQGGAAPPSQTVTTEDSPVATVSYAVTTKVTTPVGGTWLSVTPAGGQIGGSTTSFQVNANPAGLTPGTYTGVVTVYAPDSNGTKTENVNFTITGASPPTITTTTPPAGEAGAPYSYQLAATGGTLPYTWSVSSGALPANVTLNSSTGLISGTPSATGTFNVTVKVTDNLGNSATAPISIVINAGPTVTSATLPNGTVGVFYTTTVSATGGTTPYTWALASGSLPTSLTLNTSTGVISGTPTASGTFNFSLKVTDHLGSVSPAVNFSITIGTGVTITTTTPPAGEVGAAYSYQLAASGGTPPYTWSISSGALPGNVTLSTSTGLISGTPSAAGTFGFTVKVTDNGGTSFSAPMSIVINAGPTITTTSLPAGEVGVTYSATLAETGGTAPFNWTVTSGSLPNGLTLNASTGAITGSPTATGSSSFTVTLKDADNITTTANLSITVSGVTVTTTTLPSGTIGTAYNASLSASGGTGPYTWTLSGSLPAGLSLSTAGAITGTPTTAGTSTFSVTAKDSLGSPSPAANLSITIVSALTITTTSPLPAGVVNVAYSQTLQATGGTAPYTWTLAGGSLPGGLSLASNGAITGTPTASGSFSFSVSVKDANNLAAGPAALTLTINPALTITTTSLPNGVVNSSYSASLQAQGGIAPYSSWTVTVGSLPAGLTLNSSSGVISGSPTTPGTSNFTVTVKDSANNTSAPANLAITVTSGLTILTTNLPNGSVNVPYSQTLSAAGGVPPYSSWTVTSGSLPAGLTLNATSGAISGTPTTAGTSSFSVTVKDSANTTSPAQPLTLTIVSPVTITTNSLPAGTVGASYSQALAAMNGTPPYSSWTIASGSLPPGLTLNSSTGVISGTPSTSTGSPFSFTVTVKDSAGVTSAPASLSISIVGSLTITTNSLPSGTVNVAYSQNLAAAGGTPPYTWTLSSGNLPAGLTLSTGGAITGTPTTSGTSSFTVTVKDSNSVTAGPVSLSITINGALTITTNSLPGGTVGAAYTTTLAASGGTPPYNTWTVATGSLPGGLTLNASSGVISGNPTTAGTFSFTVTVKDSAGNTSNPAALSIVIANTPLKISTTTLPNGTAGVAYSQTLAAQGGTPPYSSWTVASGSLPAGLSLNASSGTISGTPSASGTSAFTVTVKDSTGTTSPAQSLSITIGLPVTITTTSLPGATVGVAYTQTLSATGGTPPYSTWLVTSGTLPPGLTLNSATGTISGTPSTATGSPFIFSVTVKDSAGNTSAAQSLSLTVSTAVIKIGSPSTYFFTLANTSAPATGSLTLVASDGSALPFTITAGPATAHWLTFSPSSGNTPATVVLTANPAGLIPGIYPAPLIVTSGATTITVPAQLTVTGSNLVATPSILTFNYTPGSPLPPPATVALTTASGTGTVALSSVTTDVSWLKVTPATSAPATLQVSISPGLLSAGTYNGDVIIKGVGSPDTSLEIPVTITIAAAPAITAAPSSLSFTYAIGGTVPAAQSLSISAGNTSLNFTATGPSWVTVVPSKGTTPATAMVTVNPIGIGPGTYSGAISVTALGATGTATVNVNLTVTGTPQLTVTPSQLSFSAAVGGAVTAPQTLTISSASALGFTAAAGSTWLSVTPTSGTTPATLSVTANPSGLAAGTYTGTVNITQAGAATVSQMIIVTFTVGNGGTSTPLITGVINAASGATGSVAPGEAISIFGTNLGPATSASFALPAEGGTVATTLGGTQVFFDGAAVPLLYVSATQVNALVPYAVSTKANTVLTVEYNNGTSAALTLPVVASLPGLFTADASGKGEGAILNQDFSINSATNPAPAGSTIQLFGTGGGVTNPASVDGALNPISSTGALVTTPVTATVGGQPAVVYYSGPAPNLISGIIQIDVTLPAGTASGAVPVVVTIGTASSQANVTVYVQ